MVNTKKYFNLLILSTLFFMGGYSVLNAQGTQKAVPPTAEEVAALRSAVAANPNDLAAHQKYLTAYQKYSRAMEQENDDALEKEYQAWMKQFPQSSTIPFAIGEALCDKESPKAKPYLLKAVALDPKLAKAYRDLWIDAERWGDFAGGRAYLAKAAAVEPANPDYAFYYANSFSDTDPAKYHKMSFEVSKNFPTSERGAQSLYWLANRSKDPKEKIAYYKQLHDAFPPEKFNWSSSGMSEYFDALLENDANQALSFAQEMAQTKGSGNQPNTWDRQVTLAQNVIQAQSLIKENKAVEASAVLKKTVLPRYTQAKKFMVLLKARADDAAGDTKGSYDSLVNYFAKEPIEDVQKAITYYGNKLGKTAADVNADIWKNRDGASKVATPFTLARYLTPGSTSLSDYRGKVVLLTYWFPGCGPCRGEFPHFENVVRKFKGKDVEYVGINISPEQNEYVIPFMKGSGYSFTPLEDVPKRDKGNLDNRNAAPVNFLIDQDGKIVFSNFRISESNEKTLELMISSLLNRSSVATRKAF